MLNVVTGADEVVGPVVVGDPRIRHVCFTGSVGGGKRIMTMAAANVTNVTLELGGNDPALVLDDAVLDEAAFAKMSGATFMTTGQVCMALKRLYVPRSRYDEVVDGLRGHAGERQKVGPGLDPDDHDGPAQHGQAAGLRGRAARAGAGGGRGGADATASTPATGRRATTCCRRSSSTRRPTLGIVAEEQFGPALPDHAVRRRGAGDPAGQRHLVRPVLVGVVR